MKAMPMFFRLGCAALVLGTAANLRATELTFQVYNEPTTNTLYTDLFYGWSESDSGPWPNTIYSYGDNVAVFNDPTSHGGKYFTYGAGRGATPDITVLYRPDNWGVRMFNASTFGNPYGDLQDNFIYETLNPSWVKFTPSATTAVQVVSFDIGSYLNVPRTPVNATLALVQDYTGTPGSGTLLWYGGTSASGTGQGDVTYTVPAGHLTFTVPDTFNGTNTAGAVGHPVSLVFWGGSQAGNLGIDNISFFQDIPEPSTSLLILGGASLVLYRARRA